MLILNNSHQELFLPGKLGCYMIRVDYEETCCTNQGIFFPNKRICYGIKGTILSVLDNLKTGNFKELEIRGRGFKFEVYPNVLKISLGFSHKVFYKPEPQIILKGKGKKILFWGLDKSGITNVSHRLISLKKKDAYKGKGIHLKGAQPKLKIGKIR